MNLSKGKLSCGSPADPVPTYLPWGPVIIWGAYATSGTPSHGKGQNPFKVLKEAAG